MLWNPHFAFNGQCEAAFKFYERCLGGKITAMVSYGETPFAEYVPADHHNKIMNARLVGGSQVLMGCDAQPGQPYEGIKGCSVAVQADTPEEADRMFSALAENGVIIMPIAPTFWAVRFGMLTDQFGVPWMINCENPK